MARIFRVAAALLCVLLLCGLLSGCEGEPAGDDSVFPTLANTYAENDFENVRFRCTVSWDTEAGETIERELSKADSIELYNLLDRGSWKAPEESPTASVRPILCLEFTTGDSSKPKNCFGCVYLSDSDDLVYTQSGVLGGLSPFVAPKGTYDAVWEKIAAVTGA